MDEPLANLDYKLREGLRSDFERLFSEEDTTVVYATPQAGDALSMSTHVSYLHDGKILQAAPTNEIYYRPQYLPVASYLGEPPMNIVPAQVVEDGADRFFEIDSTVHIPAGSLSSLSPNHDYFLGFRPQDMHLVDNGADATIEPELSFVETVGSTSTLHMDFQGREIYALSSDPVHMEKGATLSFALDPEKFYVFDSESGDLIATGAKIPSFS
jgi:ABC-type sugar transport system ATPase subunit